MTAAAPPAIVQAAIIQGREFQRTGALPWWVLIRTELSLGQQMDRHPMACHPAKVVLAAVAGVTIVGSLLFVVLHDTNHIHLTMRGSSPTTQLFHDLGNQLVEGYSCTGITTHAPCSPVGGECKGIISQSCSCNPGFSGYPCDWGPPVADRTTRYSNDPPMTPTEELQRIAMAYGFSNAIYQEQSQMTVACPGFGRFDQAIGTAQLHVVSDDASTHAGASLILGGQHSPSGRAEAIFGFRGMCHAAGATL